MKLIGLLHKPGKDKRKMNSLQMMRLCDIGGGMLEKKWFGWFEKTSQSLTWMLSVPLFCDVLGPFRRARRKTIMLAGVYSATSPSVVSKGTTVFFTDLHINTLFPMQYFQLSKHNNSGLKNRCTQFFCSDCEFGGL